jgi:hypothetical protein
VWRGMRHSMCSLQMALGPLWDKLSLHSTVSWSWKQRPIHCSY